MKSNYSKNHPFRLYSVIYNMYRAKSFYFIFLKRDCHVAEIVIFSHQI